MLSFRFSEGLARSKDITEQFHIVEQMIGMMEVAKEPLSNLADNRRSKIGRLNVLHGHETRTDFIDEMFIGRLNVLDGHETCQNYDVLGIVDAHGIKGSILWPSSFHDNLADVEIDGH